MRRRFVILVINICGLGILTGKQPCQEKHGSLSGASVQEGSPLVGGTAGVSLWVRLAYEVPDLTGNWHLVFTIEESYSLTARLNLKQRGENLEAMLEIDNHTLRGVWRRVENHVEIAVQDAENRIELVAEVQRDNLIGTWKNADGESGSWEGFREAGRPAQAAFCLRWDSCLFAGSRRTSIARFSPKVIPDTERRSRSIGARILGKVRRAPKSWTAPLQASGYLCFSAMLTYLPVYCGCVKGPA